MGCNGSLMSDYNSSEHSLSEFGSSTSQKYVCSNSVKTEISLPLSTCRHHIDSYRNDSFDRSLIMKQKTSAHISSHVYQHKNTRIHQIVPIESDDELSSCHPSHYKLSNNVTAGYTVQHAVDKSMELRDEALTRGADEILPFLLLGAYHNVSCGDQICDFKLAALQKNDVNSILTIASECSLIFPQEFTCMKVSIFDLPGLNISAYFQACIDFIDQTRYDGGKVLVHCMLGVSRSPTIVIAYLMARCDMSLEEAYDFVKKKRPFIAPNNGFIRALRHLEADLCPY